MMTTLLGGYTLGSLRQGRASSVICALGGTEVSQEIKLHADDISCSHCAATIKRELSVVEGVVSVEVDVPTKTIDLHYADEAALLRAKEMLDEIGYPVAQS
jgi:copper chaperone CopZ